MQRETERFLLALVEHAAAISPASHLVFSGGVAMNCRANQRIEESGVFDTHSFTPAASDAGIPLGAALFGHAHVGGEPERLSRSDLFLGRSAIPAVVHADGTARPQVLRASDEGLMARIVRAFRRRTGIGVLINTTFNLAGDPIVETPDQAIAALRASDLDAVVFPHVVVCKPNARESLGRPEATGGNR